MQIMKNDSYIYYTNILYLIKLKNISKLKQRDLDHYHN